MRDATDLMGRYGCVDQHLTLHLARSITDRIGLMVCGEPPVGCRWDDEVLGSGPVVMLSYERICGVCADILGITLMDQPPDTDALTVRD